MMRSANGSEFAELLRRIIGATAAKPEVPSALLARDKHLTSRQIIALQVLVDHGPQPISSLSERMGMSLSSTSQIVGRLLRAGYVVCEVDRHDRRIRRARAHPKGTQFVAWLHGTWERQLCEAFLRVSPDIRARLVEVLEAAAQVLEQPGRSEGSAVAP